MTVFFILFFLVVLEQTFEHKEQDEFFKKRDIHVGEIVHSDSSQIDIKFNKNKK